MKTKIKKKKQEKKTKINVIFVLRYVIEPNVKKQLKNVTNTLIFPFPLSHSDRAHTLVGLICFVVVYRSVHLPLYAVMHAYINLQFKI